MRFKILNSKEKRKFEEMNDIKVEGMILKMKDKLRIYTGNLTREELLKIGEKVDVIRIGLTFKNIKKERFIKGNLISLQHGKKNC